jgi:hypothetical protein
MFRVNAAVAAMVIAAHASTSLAGGPADVRVDVRRGNDSWFIRWAREGAPRYERSREHRHEHRHEARRETYLTLGATLQVDDVPVRAHLSMERDGRGEVEGRLVLTSACELPRLREPDLRLHAGEACWEADLKVVCRERGRVEYRFKICDRVPEHCLRVALSLRDGCETSRVTWKDAEFEGRRR